MMLIQFKKISCTEDLSRIANKNLGRYGESIKNYIECLVKNHKLSDAEDILTDFSKKNL